MGKRYRLIVPGAALLLLGVGLWSALLAGAFRQETAHAVARIVHRDPGGSHYKFLYRNRVYEGRLEAQLEEGTEVAVSFDPDRPDRHHATSDGRRPPVTQDSGFALPAIVGTFAAVIGIGFLLGIGKKPSA